MFIEANFSAKGADSTRYTAKPLTFFAGAMLYVVVEELIPEMSQGQHSNVGTVVFCGVLQCDDGAGRSDGG